MGVGAGFEGGWFEGRVQNKLSGDEDAYLRFLPIAVYSLT